MAIASCMHNTVPYIFAASASKGMSRNIWTPEMYGPPRSKYFEIFRNIWTPSEIFSRVHSACCSRDVNCTENGRPRFVRSWDDTLLIRCHESGL